MTQQEQINRSEAMKQAWARRKERASQLPVPAEPLGVVADTIPLEAPKDATNALELGLRGMVESAAQSALASYSALLDDNLTRITKVKEQGEALISKGATLNISVADVPKGKVDGLKHKSLERLITLVSNGLPTLMVGMAGTGKTHAGEQVASALDIPFYAMSVGAQTSKSDIIGYMSATGDYTGTLFRTAYEMGGVFLAYINKEMPTAQHSASSDYRGTNSFHALSSFTEAMNIYKNHPEKVTKFTENDLRLEGGDASGIDIQYDVSGDFVDIGRYLSGEPECFGYMDNGVPRGQRMTIVYSINWRGSVGENLINERSKHILRIVDWLESQGIRVQIVCVNSSSCEHTEILVKRYDEPLSLTNVAVTSHSDFLRRIVFRFSEYSDTWSGGYGRPSLFEDYIKGKQYETLPDGLKDGHTLYFGTQNESNIGRVFANLEQQLATTLSDPLSEPQLFKVMV